MLPLWTDDAGERVSRDHCSDVKRRRGLVFAPFELLVLLGACALCAVVLTAFQKWTHWNAPVRLQPILIGLLVASVMLWIRRRRSKATLLG